MKTANYTLPDLPYQYDALEPVISKEIMTLHHDKHHAAYVTGANAALDKLEKARGGDSSIDLKSTMSDLSFHVNGHLMHSIFWMNLRPAKEKNEPSEKTAQLLTEQFGSVEKFKQEFANAAKKVEGSGWAVLAADYKNNLLVHQVEKHNLLHLATFDPILVIDVWEHAYYLDYKNDRGAYVDNFWKIVNWDDVEKRVLGCDCCLDNDCEGCLTPEGCCGECGDIKK